MKKFIIVPLIALLTLVLCFGGTAYAQETETALPDPGTTPDSPFYFMDQWGKSLSLAFTFNSEAKAEMALRYANENMAEINAMMAQNKIKQAVKAAEQYNNRLLIANQNMAQAKTRAADLSEQIALMVENHLEITNAISNVASEEGKVVMTRTRETAMISQETALKNMAQGDPEKAANLNLQLMERQLNRVRVQSEVPQAEGIQQCMQEYNRLGNLGAEISQIAKGLGKETAIDQLVGQATAHHLEVLALVQERLQGQDQQVVQDAIQNRLQAHEQVVTRLQQQNQLGNVPEEIPNLNMYQNMDQNRTGQTTQPASTNTQSQTGQTTPQSTPSAQPATTPSQSGQSNTPGSTTTPGGQGGSQQGGKP